MTLRIFITIPICAVLLSLMSCARAQQSPVNENHSLVRDFALSERIATSDKSDKTFARGFVSVGAKQVPCLIQRGPGEIQYFYRLEKEPVLRLSTYFSSKGSKINATVTVESEDGKVERHDVSEKGAPFYIDLKQFERRIVRITFAAAVPRKKGVFKKFYWLDPAIVQQSEMQEQSASSDQIEKIRTRQKNRNVLIALFDAANPTHLGSYGYHRDTSPNIDALAAEGVLFENAIAQAAHTLASTGSLFTGLYPEGHGVLWRPRSLDLRFKTMAEAFLEVGYQTFMASCNPNASPVVGYGQGFQEIWSPRTGRLLNAPQLAGRFINWLDQNPTQQKPFFAYLHFREPHKPYAPPDFYRRRFEPDQSQPLPNFRFATDYPQELRERVEAAYDANIAHVDAQFGRIMQKLKHLRMWDNTIIIVLSDHGEGFWEHGKQGHNLPVYEEIIRIPLIIRLPGERHLKGVRRDEPAGSIDIYPTMTDLFRFSRRGIRFQGQSLLPLFAPEPRLKDRHLMSQAVRKVMFTVRSRNLKYILDYRGRQVRGELYDLSRDPQEREDLSEQRPILASYLRSQITKIRRDATRDKMVLAPGLVDKVRLDEQTIEELRALGYVGNE